MKQSSSTKRTRKLGVAQKKILLLLCAGVAMGLTRSPRVQLRVMKELAREWQGMKRATLTRSVGSLYQSKLVRRKRHRDGTETLVLTEEGRLRALRYNLETLEISSQKRWDGKWRVVMYDVPEDMRHLRLELLRVLKQLGFYELQHSVFVHPHECKDEIEYLIEAFDAREHVRRMTVAEIDSPEPLLKHFKLRKRKGRQ